MAFTDAYCECHLLTTSSASSPPSAQVVPKEMLIGALLRVPAQAIHRRIIAELNAPVSRRFACRTWRCCSFGVRMGSARVLGTISAASSTS
jgi:hypothetical protein